MKRRGWIRTLAAMFVGVLGSASAGHADLPNWVFRMEPLHGQRLTDFDKEFLGVIAWNMDLRSPGDYDNTHEQYDRTIGSWEIENNIEPWLYKPEPGEAWPAGSKSGFPERVFLQNNLSAGGTPISNPSGTGGATGI